jgi:rubrerythrin
MNFLQVAKEIEQQGCDHYNALADNESTREFAGIFRFLAAEEIRHFQIFDAMDKKTALPPVETTDVVAYAKKIFQSLSEQFKASGGSSANYEEVYEKALQFENKSIEFYTRAIDENLFTGEADQQILLDIIRQENIHAKLISGLMEFLRHPGEWLENAEFFHSEEF